MDDPAPVATPQPESPPPIGSPLAILPGAVLGLDVGNRRLGVALLEPRGAYVHPLKIILRGKGHDDWADLRRLFRMHECRGFIVGIPLLKDGAEGEQARAVRCYLKALRRQWPTTWVALVNEHLTSFEVENPEGVEWSPGRRPASDDRAAAAILRRYLEEGPVEILPVADATPKQG